MNITLSDEDKKKETDEDEEDKIDTNKTVVFNIVVDLSETTLHDDNNYMSKNDSFYRDEEVSYEELQNKYDLRYNKWIDPVEISKELKKSWRFRVRRKY